MFSLNTHSTWSGLCCTFPHSHGGLDCKGMKTPELLSPEMSHENVAVAFACSLAKVFWNFLWRSVLGKNSNSSAEEQRCKESVEQICDQKYFHITVFVTRLAVGLRIYPSEKSLRLPAQHPPGWGVGMDPCTWLALLGGVMCEVICVLCVTEHSTKLCPCCVTVVTLALSPNSWSSGTIKQLGKEVTGVRVASPFC